MAIPNSQIHAANQQGVAGDASRVNKKKSRRGKRPPRPFKRDRTFAKRLKEAQEKEEAENVATAQLRPDERYGCYWRAEIGTTRRLQATRWDLDRIDCADEWHSDPENWDTEDDVSDEEPAATLSEAAENSSDDSVVEVDGPILGLLVTNNEATARPDDKPSPPTTESVISSTVAITFAPLAASNEATTRPDNKPFTPATESVISSTVPTSFAPAPPNTMTVPPPTTASPVATSGGATTVQPTGTYCIVLCRLSSWSSARKYYTSDSKQNAAGRQRVVDDLCRDGKILARRLEKNGATRWKFEDIVATAHKRLGDEFTNFGKTRGVIPESVVEIRGYFDSWPAGAVATVLIRAPDGLTICEHTFLTFLEMARSRDITLQLIFQYIKVYNEIRPLNLQPFKGLGSVLVLDGDECLAHMLKEEGGHSPDVQRLLDIWAWLRDSKNKNQGIQDRNDLPDENMLAAMNSTPGQKTKARKGTGPTGKGKAKASAAASKGKAKA